jgi:hypothetical protein
MQTMDLSCVKISTISKWIEPRFNLSLVTLESHRVCPKRFLCIWYVRCKPCTYLALTLTQSQTQILFSSLRYVQRKTMHQSCIKSCTITKRTKLSFPWASSPRSPIERVQNDFYDYGVFSANHAPILHYTNSVSKRLKWDSTWPTSLTSSIGCVQNYLWSYGTFSANHVPILHHDYHYLQIDRIELHQTLIT